MANRVLNFDSRTMLFIPTIACYSARTSLLCTHLAVILFSIVQTRAGGETRQTRAHGGGGQEIGFFHRTGLLAFAVQQTFALAHMRTRAAPFWTSHSFDPLLIFPLFLFLSTTLHYKTRPPFSRVVRSSLKTCSSSTITFCACTARRPLPSPAAPFTC